MFLPFYLLDICIYFQEKLNNGGITLKPYLEKVSSVLSEFGTSSKGLSQEEAKKRLLSDGPNKLAEGKKESLIKKFLEQLKQRAERRREPDGAKRPEEKE